MQGAASSRNPRRYLPSLLIVQINIPHRKNVFVKSSKRFFLIAIFCQGIADIDQQDSDNPQLCAEYAPFMYGYLRQLERQLAIKQDFFKVSF
jgi:hypothetical protein